MHYFSLQFIMYMQYLVQSAEQMEPNAFDLLTIVKISLLTRFQLLKLLNLFYKHNFMIKNDFRQNL